MPRAPSWPSHAQVRVAMRVFDEIGTEVNATFHVDGATSPWTICFESRGGSRGAPNARNTQYNLGLEIVLQRLSQLDAILVNAAVDSRVTRELSGDERRLHLPTPYPLPLASVDVVALRREMGAAQLSIGRAAGARGPGNNTRRITLQVAVDEKSVSPESLELFLAQGSVATDPFALVEALAAPLRGQAFLADADLRRAIELCAMEQATAFYVDEGWVVDDVSSSRSYDLHCARRGAELHVEVKGTTGLGERVLLTRNEVNHAREAFPNTALVIVTNILVKGGQATGGKMSVYSPWDVDAGVLTIVAMSWEAG